MRQIILSKNYSRAIKSVLLFIFFSTICFLLLWGANSALNIKYIIIKGYQDATPLRGLSSYYQKNILFASAEELKKNLFEQNPQLQLIVVQKVFPNTLVLNVELRSILALLEMNGGYAYLSKEGKIIQKNRQQRGEFPLIKYYQKLNYAAYSAGDDIQYIDLLSSLHFINKLRDLGLRTDTVDINGLDMLLFTIGSKKIFFTSEKNKEIQDYELEQIIRQFKIEGKDFASLDLRFEKPIIRF